MTYVVIFLVAFGIGFASRKYDLINKLKELIAKQTG